MIALLAAGGFDAHRAGSMTAIPPPAERPELAPAKAIEALEHLVYLPCYSDMPDSELERMAQVVGQSVRGSQATPAFARPLPAANLGTK